MVPGLKEVFRRGLMKAAESTGKRQKIIFVFRELFWVGGGLKYTSFRCYDRRLKE